MTATFVGFEAFNSKAAEAATAGIHMPMVTLKGSTLAQSLEPEFVTFVDDNTLIVVCQENNAFATLNLTALEFDGLHPLGFKSWERHAIDASDRDDTLGNFTSWANTWSMFNPDTIVGHHVADGTFYIATANEGDAQHYLEDRVKACCNECVAECAGHADFPEECEHDDSDTIDQAGCLACKQSKIQCKEYTGTEANYETQGALEEYRAKDLTLNSTIFPDADTIQANAQLGRLKVTATEGYTGTAPTAQSIDGVIYDKIVGYGARSFSLWKFDTTTRKISLAWDSNTQVSQKAFSTPWTRYQFNTEPGDEGKEDRSDDKGAEPEGLAIGDITDSAGVERSYLFGGGERSNHIYIWDITNVSHPTYLSINSYSDCSETDLTMRQSLVHDVESMQFIPAASNPTGKDVLLTVGAKSGSLHVFEVAKEASVDRCAPPPSPPKPPPSPPAPPPMPVQIKIDETWRTTVFDEKDNTAGTFANTVTPKSLKPIAWKNVGGEASAEFHVFVPPNLVMVCNDDAGKLDAFTLQADGSFSNLVSSVTFPDETPQSIAVGSGPSAGIVAVALDNKNRGPSNAHGRVAIFDLSRIQQGDAPLYYIDAKGYLPDHVSFTPDGSKLLVAIEGEPTRSGDWNDPVGGVTVITSSGSWTDSTLVTATFVGFEAFNVVQEAALNAGISMPMVILKGSTVAQSLEPEYIAYSADSTYATVILQENNAAATLDLTVDPPVFRSLNPFGFKSWAHHAIDASDEDDTLGNFKLWANTWSMFNPDTAHAFDMNSDTYLVTANEGDSQHYTEDRIIACCNECAALCGGHEDFPEECEHDDSDTINQAGCLACKQATIKCKEYTGTEANYETQGALNEYRAKDLTLNSTIFPNASTIQAKPQLGRLKVTSTEGYDRSGTAPTAQSVDGVIYDKIVGYGARSFSIWKYTDSTTMSLVWDSNTQVSQKAFNTRWTQHQFNTEPGDESEEKRSDDKGAEPEGLAIGETGGRRYLFGGGERSSHIYIWDITDPEAPVYLSINSYNDCSETDYSKRESLLNDPEAMQFVPAASSPTGKDILISVGAVSGSLHVFEVVDEDAKDYCAPPPSPPSPPAPPPDVVLLELVFDSTSLTDFAEGSDNYNTVKTKVATEAVVPESNVALEFTLGSVISTAAITVPSTTNASQITTNLNTNFGTAAAATTLLSLPGIAVEQVPSVVIASPPSPPPSPPSPPPPSKSGLGGGAIAGIVVGVLLAVSIIIVACVVMSRSSGGK